MTTADARLPVLGNLLAAPVTVAEPDVVGALAVFPLIAAAGPRLEYVAFAPARKRGVEIKELPGRAEVGTLEVSNPLELAVLLYEGEEVLGAQQNRTLDVSVLVPAHSSVEVPVTCVEQGRWDAVRHGEPFAPAPQAAHPELRRMKNAQVRARLVADEAPRASQQAVWASVASTAARHGVESATGALHDVFEDRRELIERTRREISMKCSQVGMLAAIGGRFVVLDYVSDVVAFAALQGPLVAGCALDALGTATDLASMPTLEDARDFVALLLATPAAESRAVGQGRGLAFDFGGLAGSGLAETGELVTLTAFAG